MPIQYTPACTNRLDLIGRLIGQVHGMAHGCHLFNGDALADLQANLEEMVDFAKNPNITGCDPQALKFIDYNGVGPLQEMLKEVNSLIERHQKNPKQYVDNRLATTTIGDIESEWIFAIQQLNNFYNKRMDTGTNGTSDLIVPCQPYTPLRVIEEGMDSTGCPVPAAYHHIRSNPVQCLIDAGGGYQVIHPETGEVLTYEEAVSTLSKQYGKGPRGLPWYKPASEGEAIWYIRYLIAPMIRDRNVQMAQGRHENEILDYARADYNQLLWGVDASSDDSNHALALYRAIIQLRGDSGVPYTETPPLLAKMKELLPTELNHWHDLLRLESDLSARADAIDERDNKIVEAIYLAEEAAIERGVQTGDCPPPKRGTHRIVPPQGETWSSRAWKQFPGKDPSAWYHHSGEWELARIIKAGGGIKDIVDPKTGEILSLQEAEKKLNFQVSPRQHWGPWDEQYYQSTFPNSPISDWVSGTIGSLRHMRNEADWSRQIETTSKQMHADEKVIEWYDDFITDLPTGVPIHDATRTLRPQEQFYVDNLPRSVTGERQIIQLIEKLDNQRSKLHDEDLPMLHAIADAEQAAIIRGLNVDAEETPGTWMDTRPPSVQEAISRATHYSGGFLYLNDPRFDQLLAEEDIVANLHFVPEEGTGLYPDDESWDDYTIAESAEARKQEHLHRQLYNMKNTLLRAYMDMGEVPDIDPDRDAREMYQQFVDRFLVPNYEGADFTQRGETLPSERMLQLLPTSVGGAADLFAVEDKIDQFAEVLRQEDNDILRLIMEAEEKAIEADQAGIEYVPSAMARRGSPTWSTLTPEQQEEWRKEAEQAAQVVRDEWIRAVGRGPNYMEQDLWEIIMPSTNWVGWNLPFPRGGQVSSPMLQERWKGRKIPLWLKIRAYAVTPEGQAKTQAEIARELGVGLSTVSRALQGRSLDRKRGQHQYYGPPIEVRVDEITRKGRQTQIEHGFQTPFGELPPEDLPWEYIEQRNADIIRLHGEGKLNEDIWRELGVGRSVVHKALKDAGLTPNITVGRGRIKGIEYPIEAQIEEARRLRAEGLTHKEIGERLGLGEKVVGYHLRKPSAVRIGGRSLWSSLTPEEQEEWREEAEAASQAVRDEWIRAVGRGPNYMEQDLWEIVIPKGNWASWSLPFPRGGQVSSSMLQERWKEQKIPNWLKIRAFAMTPEGQAMTRTEIAKELGVAAPNVSTALQGYFLYKPTGRYNYYGPPIQVRMDERFRRGQQTRIEHGYSTPFGEMPPEDEPLEYIEQRNTDILRLHGEGISANRIAQEMGGVREEDRKVLEDAGLTPNPHMRKSGRPRNAPLTEVQLEEMRRLRAEGLSYAKIAERLEISKRAVWHNLQKPSEEETPGTWIDTRSKRVQEAIWRGTGGFNLTLRHPLTNEIVTEGTAIDSLHYLPDENTGLYPDSEAWDTFTHTGTLESYAQAQLSRDLDYRKGIVTDLYRRKMDDPSIDVDKESRELYGSFREEYLTPSEKDANVTTRGLAMPPPRILEMFPTRISGAADLIAVFDKVDQFERVLEQEDQEVLKAIMEAEANAIEAGQQNILYTPSAMRRGGSRTWSTLTPEQQEEWREEAEQAAQAKRDEWIRAVGRGPDYMQQDLWEIIMPKSNWAGWNLPFPRGGQISSSRLEERWQGRKIPNWLKIRAFAATPEGQAMNEAEIARELGVSSSRVSTALQGHQLDRARGQHQYYGPPIQVRMDEVRRKAEQTRIERGFATPFGELSPEEQPLEYIEQRDADIIRLHGEGKVTDEIWRELGLSERIVSRILKKAGLTPNMNIHGEAGNGRRRLTAAHIEEARRLRAEGLSYREIGERLGLPRKTVWYNLQKPASWFDNYPLQIKKRIKDAGGLIVKHPDTGQEMTLLEVSRREHYDYHSNPTVNPYTPTAQTMLERHAKSTHARWLNRIKNDLAAPIRAWGLDQSPEWVDWNARNEYEELLRWHRDWPTKGQPTDQKINMLDEWDRFGHIMPEEVTGVNDLIQLRHTIEKEQQKLLDSDRKLHIAVMNAEDELFGFNAPNTPSAWLGSMETPPEYDKDIFDYSYNQKLAETEGMADLVMWRGSQIGPSGTKPDITRSVMEDYPVEVMQEEGYTDASVNWDIGDIHVSLDKGPWRNQYGEMETVAQVAIETMVDAGESGSAIFGAEGQIGKINELLREYQRLNPGIRVIANARGEQHPESGRARGRGDIRARVYARYGWVRLPEGRTMGGGILMELPSPVEDDIPGAFSGVSKYANDIMELVG